MAQKYAALLVPGRPERREAERLARLAPGVSPDWGALEIEIFPGREETLLLIHPASGVYIAERAVHLLSERFGDRQAGY